MTAKLFSILKTIFKKEHNPHLSSSTVPLYPRQKFRMASETVETVVKEEVVEVDDAPLRYSAWHWVIFAICILAFLLTLAAFVYAILVYVMVTHPDGNTGESVTTDQVLKAGQLSSTRVSGRGITSADALILAKQPTTFYLLPSQTSIPTFAQVPFNFNNVVPEGEDTKNWNWIAWDGQPVNSPTGFTSGYFVGPPGRFRISFQSTFLTPNVAMNFAQVRLYYNTSTGAQGMKYWLVQSPWNAISQTQLQISVPDFDIYFATDGYMQFTYFATGTDPATYQVQNTSLRIVQLPFNAPVASGTTNSTLPNSSQSGALSMPEIEVLV